MEVRLNYDAAPSWEPPAGWDAMDGGQRMEYLDGMRARMLAAGTDGDE